MISKQRESKPNYDSKAQVESLHKALLATHSAQSVAEIQTLLTLIMAKAFDLDWVRVFIHTSEHIEEQLRRLQDRIFFCTQLKLSSHTLGRIVFARKSKTKFNRSEKLALQQIADSVALAIDLLAKLDQAENLKQQWDSTFDAIFEPLCLTDENFNILRTNKAFLLLVNKKHGQVTGLSCFSVFCGSNTPAPVLSSTNAFILDRVSKNTKNTYEVSTQRIRTKLRGKNLLLTIFRNITNQKKIEKQIFESSKMAELGTIGSSIAHDINNPLGGMLNFLQLIKNDLPQQDALYEDILQMEKAGLRCKEIVETLLRFSRKQEVGAAEPVDLKEVIEHSLKIADLQTRSIGINIQYKPPTESVVVTGHFNLLSQALSHVLQNAFEAVSEKLTQSPRYRGVIRVEIFNAPDGPGVNIIDNGIGITPELQGKILNPMFSTKRKNQNKGLGLTLAYQIIDNLGGQLEIFSQPNVETQVKISFRNV